MKIDVLGIKIDALKRAEMPQRIKDLLNTGKSIFMVTPYSESIVAAQKDAEFRNVLNSADIAIPDGIGILWAANFLKRKAKSEKRKVLWNLAVSLFSIIFKPDFIKDPIPEKISGVDFVWDLAKLAAENNYSIFLLGGFGGTPERAGEALKRKFPNLKIAGTSAAPSPDEINDSQADFLLVALGPIRQEKWIYHNLPNLRVKLAIGLGGTFDYLAQKKPYRPKFWATRGLEWLWRLLTQPRRIGRICRGVLGLIYYCLIYEGTQRSYNTSRIS